MRPIFSHAWLIFVFLSHPASASDRFLCASDQAAGFAVKGDKWELTRFTVDDEKFLVEQVPNSERPDLNYVVTKFGEAVPFFVCSRAIREGFVSPQILCGNMVAGGSRGGMIVDADTLRFQEYAAGGYVANDLGTASITIGRCSPLSD